MARKASWVPPDVSAYGCVLPERPAPRSSRSASASEPGVPRRVTPTFLPASVVKLSDPPEAKHEESHGNLAAAVRWLVRWRAVVTFVIASALLLMRFSSWGDVLLSLICLAVTTLMAASQQGPAAAAADDDDSSVASDAADGLAKMYASTLRHFGRYSFFAGGAGVAPRSPISSPALGAQSPILPPAPRGDDAILTTLNKHQLEIANPSPPTIKASNVGSALASVLSYGEDHQWLAAGVALRALDATVAASPTHPAVVTMQQNLRAQRELSRAVATVRVRYNEVLDALRVLSEGDEVWKFAQSYRGVESHYKHDEVGRLWLKTDGVMEGVDLLECVAMWREADLFDKWFPLCHQSSVLAQQGRVEMLAYMKLAAVGLPMGSRDAVLHGYGVDALDDGFMMILGRSAQQGDFPDIEFPPVEGFGAARMHVQGLSVLIQPLGERRVRCAYVIHIDMMAPLPPPMLHFATQRVVGMIFHKMKKEARRIRQQNGGKPSAHAVRMGREAHIYEAWMKPRMLAAIAALGITVARSAAFDDENVPRTPTTADLMRARGRPATR